MNRLVNPILAAIVLSVVNNGADWRVDFPSDRRNVGIEVFTNCKLNGKLVYAVPAYAQVDGEQSFVVFHRETNGIPENAECVAQFALKRNEDTSGTSDVANDYTATGETASITWTQHKDAARRSVATEFCYPADQLSGQQICVRQLFNRQDWPAF